MLGTYLVVLVSVVFGLVVLGIVLVRSSGGLRAQPRLARLLLLSISLAISLIGVEGTTAAWLSWLHRTPTLPKVEPAPSPTLALPTQFDVKGTRASEEPLRLLVIGESSARGEPYHPWLSVGQIVAWQLEQINPARRVQVDMWAEGGASLEKMHLKLNNLGYKPDAMVVFSGHNEFQARYPWDRNPPYYLDEQEEQRKPSAVDLLLRRSSVCRLILETLDRQRVDAIPPRVVTRQLVDRPVCSDKERASIIEDFRSRLENIARYCETIDTLPIMIIPASNDGDYEPSRSVLEPTATKQARQAFARQFAKVRELELAEPAHAVAAYQELIHEAPGFAETHYRLARLLEKADRWDEAGEHYTLAREHDAMPMRCPEAFREAYRDVAANHPGIVLVDSARVLQPLAPHGFLDDHLYHDAQHPTLLGYIALAQDLLNQLSKRRGLGWPEGVKAPVIDPEACARHFQLDDKRWAEVCRRSAWFYEVTAFIRHDPTERQERDEAYKRAQKLIAEGQPPTRVGITGLGVHPEP